MTITVLNPDLFRIERVVMPFVGSPGFLLTFGGMPA